MRFDHGIPIVIRSGTAFLILEFERKLSDHVSTKTESTFQVLAPYRFQYLDLEASSDTHRFGRDTLKQ